MLIDDLLRDAKLTEDVRQVALRAMVLKAHNVSEYVETQNRTWNISDRVDRCKAVGNGQVPAVVAAVWRMIGPE